MKSFKQHINESWKHTVARNIRKLSPDQAKAHIDAVNAEMKAAGGATIHHETIKKLTGGYVSQNINFHVMRALGKKAGIIKEDVTGYHGTSQMIKGRVRSNAPHKSGYGTRSVRTAVTYARMSSEITGKQPRIYRVALPSKAEGGQYARRLGDFRSKKGLRTVGMSLPLLRKGWKRDSSK